VGGIPRVVRVDLRTGTEVDCSLVAEESLNWYFRLGLKSDDAGLGFGRL